MACVRTCTAQPSTFHCVSSSFMRATSWSRCHSAACAPQSVWWMISTSRVDSSGTS